MLREKEKCASVENRSWNNASEVDQINPQAVGQFAKQATRQKPSRLFFIDHLRAALVILVVLHHLALIYGGIPPFYYYEPPVNDPIAWLSAMVFVLLNQAWFMGAFFLLAGYFTPGSYDRKGPAAFLKDRLLRLGIPLVLFIFVLSSISFIGLWQMPASMGGITGPPTWQMYPNLIGDGPLWFVALLLIFSFGYAGWRMVTPRRESSSQGDPSPPSYLRIGIFILALALASYWIRIVIPLGKSVNLFVYFLSFPTLAYLPQYLSFFIVGIIAARHDWFRTLPHSMGRTGFVIAFVATVTLGALGFLSFLKAIDSGVSQLPPFGYGTWQSAVYALWDSMFAVGMCLGSSTLFRRFFNGQGSFGRFLSQQSYGVYVFHIPVIVLLAVALKGIELAALPKFGLMTVIAVPVCFMVAYLVRRIPFASRIF
ncbi:MAG: acyltransferase family protein [Caldilineaceae bacterium]